MKFHVLTLFPEMVMNGLCTSITGRAQQNGIIDLNAVNIRDFTLERHGKVDDYPYGGGAGMLIQAQPVFDAWQSVTAGRKKRTIYVTPQGRPFTQKMAEEFSREEELIFLCGHYEGIDERVLEEIVTDYVSIGDYVLTGGELPAMVMIDAISRLVPGVLNNTASAEKESFYNDLLEYPQYSRPEIWHDKAVPGILLSGNHRDIAKWRTERSEERTARIRPDLYAEYLKKQKCIQSLSCRKREHIHMMELLRRGNGEVLYHEEENVLLYDRKSGAYLLTAVSRKEGSRLTEYLLRVSEEAQIKRPKQFVVCQDFLKEMICDAFKAQVFAPCFQALYTRKEPLTVRHRDIRPLGEGDLAWLAARYEFGDVSYLRERLRAGVMYGAFSEGKLSGFIGIHDDGGMGFLYVEEPYRHKGIGSSLESFLINRHLERDMTPYCHVFSDNAASRALQEKLGLYLSGDTIWWLEA